MPKFVISWHTAVVLVAGLAAIVTAAALGVSAEAVSIIAALATVVAGTSHALVQRTSESTERAGDDKTPKP